MPAERPRFRRVRCADRVLGLGWSAGWRVGPVLSGVRAAGTCRGALGGSFRPAPGDPGATQVTPPASQSL